MSPPMERWQEGCSCSLTSELPVPLGKCYFGISPELVVQHKTVGGALELPSRCEGADQTPTSSPQMLCSSSFLIVVEGRSCSARICRKTGLKACQRWRALLGV